MYKNGSYECGPCEYGYTGNQTIGCHRGEGFCPSGHQCDKNARCINYGWGQYACECVTGWAGNGVMCGPDRDLDSWPDIRLPCSDAHCAQVKKIGNLDNSFYFNYFP
ncbi:hypothetical protein NQ314_021165 [Rhamnusium bicolor]|uniref:EGF-like domain-containing protein n=1 Tax=Rhamnusium bicolor TaxID=1586634 RepID=A0AAV8WI57_9CUCU|nr:hypothetical protein NQ314_021165 [Rhamnusium bicolor]